MHATNKPAVNPAAGERLGAVPPQRGPQLTAFTVLLIILSGLQGATTPRALAAADQPIPCHESLGGTGSTTTTSAW